MTEQFNDKKVILIGVILSPHGVAGAVSAECLSDNPRRFAVGAHFFDQAGNTYVLEKASTHKNRLLLIFKDVYDREAADKLRGTKLYIDVTQSESPPEGEYYHYQLTGMEVREQGIPIGILEEILPYSTNDVFLVKTPEGKEILIPALKAIVKKVDTKAGYMEVELPEGLK